MSIPKWLPLSVSAAGVSCLSTLTSATAAAATTTATVAAARPGSVRFFSYNIPPAPCRSNYIPTNHTEAGHDFLRRFSHRCFTTSTQKFIEQPQSPHSSPQPPNAKESKKVNQEQQQQQQQQADEPELAREYRDDEDGRSVAIPKRKSWKERWLDISADDSNTATFTEVWRLLKLARKDLALFTLAMVLLTLSAAIVMALPKVTGLILDATKNFTTLEDIEIYGFSRWLWPGA
ncbi:hypothetical protein PMKS-001148 [Pichia membranifaciens]|uniref:ABC transmembrane type-1 domain-containing protein n=1 Tax=Pichia membranifaciens TaxID=4926 RepID=A0A1Q2YDQ9_9ASCO|nr:hypothetical protein PMKS-001148 [Pichia membranifaciens]